MALTIEFEQKIADGSEGIALEYPGEKLQVFAKDSSEDLIGAVSEISEGDFTPTIVFDSVGVCAKQNDVEYASLHMYSTDGIYGSWLYGNKQQLVIFLLEYDISRQLESADIQLDITRAVNSCRFSFVETPDLLLEDQRSLLDPGAKIRMSFSAGDSRPYDMGYYYADRSSGQELNKIVSIEARGLIGKPLMDQSFDENYSYSLDAVTDVIEALLANAGYTADQYRVESTTAQISMSFDRKKTMYDGLIEILDAQGWQLREHPSGYLIIGSSTYSEFETPGDYEFTYDTDIYSLGFVIDDGEAFTRVCVHTDDYSICVYDDVGIYTSWRIGEQKTYYLQVADGTSSGDATAIAADLADKLSNSGTIESFTGPFRPYLLEGDTAKITKAGEQRTVGLITNIKHVMGKNGFRTEFDVDSGGVVGTGRLKDYIKRLQKKNISSSNRSYT